VIEGSTRRVAVFESGGRDSNPRLSPGKVVFSSRWLATLPRRLLRPLQFHLLHPVSPCSSALCKRVESSN
jgi:hypothetical protein